MKNWKLVSGILSIILCVVVGLESCAAGFINTVEENGEVSGSAGIIVAIMLLSGGIVSICTRKGGKGGSIAMMILYGIGALCGLTLAGTIFQDLYIWGIWCLICAVVALLSMFIGSKKNEK